MEAHSTAVKLNQDQSKQYEYAKTLVKKCERQNNREHDVEYITIFIRNTCVSFVDNIQTKISSIFMWFITKAGLTSAVGRACKTCTVYYRYRFHPMLMLWVGKMAEHNNDSHNSKTMIYRVIYSKSVACEQCIITYFTYIQQYFELI